MGGLRTFARALGRTATRTRIPRQEPDDLLRSLASVVDPVSLRSSVVGRVREFVGCDSVVLCSFRWDEGAYVSDAGVGGFEERRLTFAGGGPLARWLRANGEAFLIPHPRGAFEFLAESERAQLVESKARACVPLRSGTRLTDILILSAPAEWRLREADLEQLERLGRHVAVALENATFHQAERYRLSQAHQAEQLAVAGQLAATIAHEVRNPLSAIRSTVQYVIEGAASWDKKQAFLEQILGEVDRIEQTVSSVLALARPRDIALEDIDLIRTLEQSLLLISAHANANGITIQRQFETECMPLRGDARSLHQVWLNLLLNACQSMRAGGTIAVHCRLWQRNDDVPPAALVRITDTGTGMSPPELARVFDPFFTTKTAGTGLGLPLCLDILTKHGGSLRLESTVGTGTEATVILPVSA